MHQGQTYLVSPTFTSRLPGLMAGKTLARWGCGKRFFPFLLTVSSFILLIVWAHTLPCRPPVCPGWLIPSSRAQIQYQLGLLLWLQLLRGPAFQDRYWGALALLVAPCYCMGLCIRRCWEVGLSGGLPTALPLQQSHLSEWCCVLWREFSCPQICVDKNWQAEHNLEKEKKSWILSYLWFDIKPTQSRGIRDASVGLLHILT